jgi:hypothetical protein
MNPRYAIGQQYWTRGKGSRLCTVIDIHTTYNVAGNVVKLRYVATHEFMGQVVTDSDVPELSITMGLVQVRDKNEREEIR